MSAIDTLASGPYLTACGVLLVTGAAKVRRPGATTDALRAAFAYDAHDKLARAIGVGEIAIGTVGALAGGITAALVAATYGLLLAVATRLRRRAPDTPCGCLGARSARVGAAHLITSAVATSVAAAYAFAGGDGLARILRDQPVAGIPFLALVATAIALVVLLMEPAPEERAWQH